MKIKESVMLAKNWKNICSTDFMRPVMTGVYFDLENDCMVGTNTHIMVECPIEVEFDELEQLCAYKKQLELRREWSKIVPIEFFDKAKYMGDYKKYSMDIYYDFSDEKYAQVFMGPELVFRCKYIDGNFPNYRAVYPKEQDDFIDGIGVDLKSIKLIMDCIPYTQKHLIFKVHAKNRGITFSHPTNPNFKGILMPIIGG